MVTRKRMPARRQQILEFIQEFMTENGIPPTVRDVQKACEISSTSVVDYNLRILERDGYLNRRPDVARGIELLDNSGQPPVKNVTESITEEQPLSSGYIRAMASIAHLFHCVEVIWGHRLFKESDVEFFNRSYLSVRK